MLSSDIGSLLGGLINNGRSLPTMDVQNLLNAIQANQQGNNQLINQLPSQLQPLYAQYQAALNGAGNTLQNTVTGVGQNLLNSSTALYDPNSPAVQATLAALKTQDYSTLPGSINALKANLAGTGGLQRGGAARAITQATLAPAAQYGQQAANVQGQQLTAQQNATQQALNKIASMDDTTAQQLFGMSKDQATQILTSGRQDLQNQLTQLINSNNTATNQTLGVEGVQDTNGYNNALLRNQQQAAVVNGLTGLGVDAAGQIPGLFGGTSTGLPTGSDVTSPSYQQNSGAIASQIGIPGY
jgi:hypothetical protein